METMALNSAVGRMAKLANGHAQTGTHGEISAGLARMTESRHMHVREYQQVRSGTMSLHISFEALRHVQCHGVLTT